MTWISSSQLRFACAMVWGSTLPTPAAYSIAMLTCGAPTTQELSTQYFFSLWWSVATMTGYGNTDSVTDLQAGFSFLTVFLGVAAYVAIIGYVGNVVAELDAVCVPVSLSHVLSLWNCLPDFPHCLMFLCPSVCLSVCVSLHECMSACICTLMTDCCRTPFLSPSLCVPD